ncbi:precorrin-6y C5,15-methyltransferase (decarboxylating) subunit CbiE [Palleronia caenipelagi]|uniref:Precorrin-6y C5,15-methyltransferase (Decarboxylating) subunit CbiE n=1 Tax=Palleronia caenipelagi TaxID=2489174 RepID=A0A547Q8S6_9RHOB|nr:precorrin-6y C5,15-methyltransferase (decarboxylating) subunit CbiE [Palleronia caenipelagi]TRD22763.1 precorrin-6y C5,15-methyltransferase (decarboxylating) subunit CbiE [Palleronia caenipelagi]
MTTHWLTILGIGEDGVDGLSARARAALETAEIVMGPPRHLSLLAPLRAETCEWPVPFADGIPQLMELRGRRVVVLASGDPFWFGAGSVLTRHLDPAEWNAIPGLSCFSLAAARLGWPLERTTCLGLHAASLSRLRPHLARGARLIVTLRDGDAVPELCDFLCETSFGDTRLILCEALGGPRERLTRVTASDRPEGPFAHPLVAALEIGDGPALSLAPGRPTDNFQHDGQITKRPVRALTLAALAPRPGEHLWDIGAGSGSVALEWLLSHPTLTATAIERHPERAARIHRNALALGQDRISVVEGKAPDALAGLPDPDAIFVGGGLNATLLATLRQTAPGARLVSNAVTLETEALLLRTHAELGGDLLRIDLSSPAPLGSFTGWQPARPILQWSGRL